VNHLDIDAHESGRLDNLIVVVISARHHGRGIAERKTSLHERPIFRSIGRPELDRIANQIAGLIDPVRGGMRGAPKFPQPMMLEFLWRAGSRLFDERYFGLVELSLARMSEGGIYDHLGGGYSRYSVDERWLVPHFEKMLYDNALILELLALAHQRSGNPLFCVRAQETATWLAREMTTPAGAFCASLDADSEGEEGKFYVWSEREVAEILGKEDAAFFSAHYDVTAHGNFEGHNILNRLKHLTRSMEDEGRLAPLRAKLLAARGQDLAEVRAALERDVRYANITIIEGNNASQFGIGIVSARIAEMVLADERAVVPIGSYHKDFGVTLSLPSVVGRTGVTQVLVPEMTAEERQGLEKSAETLHNALRRVHRQAA